MLHFYSPVLPLFQLPVDARLARFNMVEQQIRPFGVLDSAVVGLLHHIDRQRFVPDAYRSLAYADIEIPIGQNQYMMEPKLEARLLQALAPKPGERILEIGTGSGFMAALLAAAGAEVTSVEIFADLSARATQALLDVGFAAVRTVVGDGSQGWPEGGPWDGILVSASAPEIPDTLLDSLAEHGRLVAVVGEDPTMQTIIMRRRADGGFHKQSLFETHVAPMIGLERKRVFSF